MIQTRWGLLYGFLLGAVIPMIPYGITYLVFKAKEMPMSESLVSSLILLSLGIDFFLVQRFTKKKHEYFVRGLILAMFGYVVYWVITFAL